LAQQGIVVPGPNRYRTLLRDTVISLKGQPASRETQGLILDQIMDEDHADRLVLSWHSFLSLAPWVLEGALYPAAAERVRAFSNIFPDNAAEFHLAIRNPATFLPALLAKLNSDNKRGKTYDQFVGNIDIQDIRWSDMIEKILAMNPDVPLTIWCDEDTPLIWPEVVQSVSGHAPDTVMEDRDELLAQIMPAEGLVRLNTYLASHPAPTSAQRRKIVSAFLDKFALPERIEMEVELPGWTEHTVADLTRAYDQDVARIMAMPGVTFLAP